MAQLKNQNAQKTRWERKQRYFSWNIKWVPPFPRQEAKPPGKTSELSQDRRQNHQERHQSYPKTGGKTTRKDIRVIPRQEANSPGKTSELSQDRRQNHQERHQSYPKTGGKTTRKDIRAIPRQEAKPPGKTSELSQDRKQNHQERHQSYPKTVFALLACTAECSIITRKDPSLSNGFLWLSSISIFQNIPMLGSSKLNLLLPCATWSPSLNDILITGSLEV